MNTQNTFKVGDRVRVKSLGYGDSAAGVKVGYTGRIKVKGKGAEIIGPTAYSVVFDQEIYKFWGDNSRYIYPKDLELIVPPIVQTNTNKELSVGDRVEVIDLRIGDYDFAGIQIGFTGTVSVVRESDPAYKVLFDQKIISYLDDNSRYLSFNSLRKIPAQSTVLPSEIKPNKPRRKHVRRPLKVGDTVIVIRGAKGEQKDLEDVYGRIGTVEAVNNKYCNVSFNTQIDSGWGPKNNMWAVNHKSLRLTFIRVKE